MRLFPAIDLYEGKAVRLLKGDYDKMTVYSDQPCEVALTFKRLGMDSVHIVDLEGARDGSTPNRETALAGYSFSGGSDNTYVTARVFNLGLTLNF